MYELFATDTNVLFIIPKYLLLSFSRYKWWPTQVFSHFESFHFFTIFIQNIYCAMQAISLISHLP